MGAGAGWRRRRGGILVPGPRPAALPALPELGAPRGPGLVPLSPLWPSVPPERPAAALTRVPGTGGSGRGWARPVPAASNADGACPGRAQPQRVMRTRAAWSSHPRPDPPVRGARRGLTRDAQRLYFAGARRGAKNGGRATPPAGAPLSTRRASRVAPRPRAPPPRGGVARV